MKNVSNLWPVNQLLEILDNNLNPEISLSATQVLILIALSKFASNGTWKDCRPSVERLSKITSLSERAIQKNIKQMQLIGIIDVKSRFNERGE